MTQEDKNLLLKDLCARIPYHPKGYVVNACTGAACDEWLTCATFPMFTSIKNNCRLYLRPMSSMTEEEKEKYQYITERWMYDANYSIADSIDWLNAHHFDFRNLIERGLVIEVTKENNPYEH